MARFSARVVRGLDRDMDLNACRGASAMGETVLPTEELRID